jgi:hypothetical protein
LIQVGIFHDRPLSDNLSEASRKQEEEGEEGSNSGPFFQNLAHDGNPEEDGQEDTFFALGCDFDFFRRMHAVCPFPSHAGDLVLCHAPFSHDPRRE